MRFILLDRGDKSLRIPGITGGLGSDKVQAEIVELVGEGEDIIRRGPTAVDHEHHASSFRGRRSFPLYRLSGMGLHSFFSGWKF